MMEITGADEFKITSRFAVSGSAPLPGEFEVVESEGFNSFQYSFQMANESMWGEIEDADPNVFVKFTNGYRNKSRIDFSSETITVSTIHQSNPKEHLRMAIETILLAPLHPDKVDVYTGDDIKLGGEPFLYKQVLDHHGEPIRWAWSAHKYAEYLVETALKTGEVNFTKSHYVSFPFNGHVSTYRKAGMASESYLPFILDSSRKYGVPSELILGIIKTESSFNPFAKSHAGALGLMQVVPSSAGADVFANRGLSGVPTKAQLFDPEFNIGVGVEYISILRDRYLRGIDDDLSLKYAVISSYNGGTKGVFRAFGQTTKYKALKEINGMSEKEVYFHLTQRHPYSESRMYLKKVLENEKKFK
ncbi:murein transglycosylase domain-containing protein [Vibrio sp. PNB22_3_1]